MKEISAINTVTTNKQNTVRTNTQPEKSFSTMMQEELNTIQQTTTAKKKGQCDIISGRIGIDYVEKGVPFRVKYFDEQGKLITNSSFNAESILKMTNKFNIDLTDLKGLGEQLDELNVGYRPYKLYAGTGSDHGIDFDDLINGGLGTAYDWRKDDLVHLKGPGAEKRLEESQQFAQTLGLKLNPLTTKSSIPESEIFKIEATPVIKEDNHLATISTKSVEMETLLEKSR